MSEMQKQFMELVQQNASTLSEADISFLAGYAIGAENARSECEVKEASTE